MAKAEKILTLHPQGKKGVNISLEKYNFIKNYIVKKLSEEGQIAYKKLNEDAICELKPSFDGSIPWYIVSVKLDLEAREIIKRIPKTSPHKITLM